MLKKFMNKKYSLDFFRPYSLTFFASLFLLLANFFIYYASGRIFNSEDYSCFIIFKRSMSFLTAILSLGLGVALPIIISRDRENNNKYFISSLILIITISFFFSFFANVNKEYASFLLFGDKKFLSLIFPFCLNLMAINIHSILFCYFQGLQKMRIANSLNMINYVLIPLSPFLFISNVLDILLITGFLILISNLMFYIFFVEKIKVNYDNQTLIFKKLLQMGVPRIPGDLALYGLFSVPVIIAVHISNLDEARIIGISLTIVSFSGSLFSSIGVVMLPRSVEMLKEGNLSRLYKEIKFFGIFGLSFGFIIIFFFIYFWNYIFSFFSINPNILSKNIMILTILSIPTFLYYSLTRSFIDSNSNLFSNIKNSIIAFCFFAIISFICSLFNLLNLYSLGLIISFSFIILSFFTFQTVKNITNSIQ
jgi:O-antigen/teichoic acid export membrane protein